MQGPYSALRNILVEKPRVTRFPCPFDTPTIPTADTAEEEDMENAYPSGGGGGGGGNGGGSVGGGGGGMMMDSGGGGGGMGYATGGDGGAGKTSMGGLEVH
jgi:hypothetical protein